MSPQSCLSLATHVVIFHLSSMIITSTEQSYSSVEEIRAALEDGEIDGALLDTYVAAEHKETLFHDKIFVKEILDRPFGYGVVLSGAAVNVEEKCRDYINLQISEIFHIIQNMTKTLDVSFIFESSYGRRSGQTVSAQV